MVRKNEKGQILVLVIIVFVVILLLGTNLLAVTTTGHRNSIAYVNKMQAKNVAKSSLDIMTHYLQTNPGEASLLLPERGTQKTVTLVPLVFKDGNNQDWESTLEIENLGNDQFKITSRVNGVNNNINIQQHMSVIVKGLDIPILGDMNTETIEIIGSHLTMQNGRVFSKNEFNFRSMSDVNHKIHLAGVAALGGWNLSGVACDLKIGEFYSGNDVNISNNEFKRNSLIGRMGFKDGYQINSYSGNRIGGISNENVNALIGEVELNVTTPSWVQNIIDAGITSKPAWVQDYEAGRPLSTTVDVVEVDKTYSVDNLCLDNKIYVSDSILEGVVITIQNDNGVTRKLDIYNPKGTVLFRWNGSSLGVVYKGSIVAKNIKFENNINITLDLEQVVGSDYVYTDFVILKYSH